MSSTQSMSRLLRVREVLYLAGVSWKTLRIWIREGFFPRPLKIGPRTQAWPLDEINSWMQTRERDEYEPKRSVR